MGSVRTLAGRGTLFMDFRFEGRRCREYTALADTPANRKRVAKLLVTIEAEIAAGTFDHAKFFPHSREKARSQLQPVEIAEAARAAVAPSVITPEAPDLRTFAESWLRDHEVEWRRSRIKVLRSTIDKHLLPRCSTKPPTSMASPRP